jgi:para-aminobenzoate synthetase/4-amino-4-deoxychorismate lyase
MGLGGGVVQDSVGAAEYAECRLKARFYEEGRPPLQLIETMKCDGGFVRLESHLTRMAASAQVFGLAFDGAKARAALDGAVAGRDGPQRVRLTLDEAGRHEADAAPLPPNPPYWSYEIAAEAIAADDLLQRHKISWRELYDCNSGLADETLFLNERGELAEGARSNIFVERDGVLLTPPLSSGALDGRLRAELIATGRAREAVLTPEDLKSTTVYLGNSLRGLIRAVPI